MTGQRTECCRSCGSRHLHPILDLGATPVANSLVDPGTDGTDPSYPLNLVLCTDCGLVQLGFILPATAIFDDDYPYYSSFSDAFCRHAAAHVDGLTRSGRASSDSFVVEIASNDGYLLRNFVERGIRALGVDPSPGPAAAAEEAGVPTIVDFFGTDVAAAVADDHGPADVIIANNVMAHVPDLNELVGGMARLLSDDGVITIENPWVRSMVEHVEFDTVYHEHYCYFSNTSVSALVERHGLHLNDIDFFPQLHGGTLRWYVSRHAGRTTRCEQALADEARDGFVTPGYYGDFADRVAECQAALRDLADTLSRDGRTLAAYGAAAKGATLLNTTGLDVSVIPFVVDRNTHKQGKLMPGCRLPIRPVEALLDDRPDDVLLLAWNFAEEIARQQNDYVGGGGRLWAPVPLPHLVADGT